MPPQTRQEQAPAIIVRVLLIQLRKKNAVLWKRLQPAPSSAGETWRHLWRFPTKCSGIMLPDNVQPNSVVQPRAGIDVKISNGRTLEEREGVDGGNPGLRRL